MSRWFLFVFKRKQGCHSLTSQPVLLRAWCLYGFKVFNKPAAHIKWENRYAYFCSCFGFHKTILFPPWILFLTFKWFPSKSINDLGHFSCFLKLLSTLLCRWGLGAMPLNLVDKRTDWSFWRLIYSSGRLLPAHVS